MGLDMYLTGKRYLWSFNDGDGEMSASIGALFPELNGMPAKGVTVELMYWRKANQVHKWFVDNVQEGKDECEEHYVNVEQLETLRDTCRAVLLNPDSAATLLPTQGGFFFGDTAYSEYFFDDVKYTADKLDAILENAELLKQWDIYYRSSW